MALRRILGVLTLVGALVLLSNALPFRHGSSRLRGPGAALADLLADALDRLDGLSVLDLATRRNMVLLCHAILLVLLGDAGILGVPAAARRRRRQELVEHTTTTITGVGYYSVAAAAPDAIRTTVVPPAVGHVATRPQLAAEPEREEQVVVVVVAAKEIVLVEKQQKTYDSDDHHPAAATVGDTIHDLSRALVVADRDDKNGAREEEDDAAQTEPAAEEVAQEEEEEEDVDVDEMNRRFEAFIADTKEKMRLEALHPAVHVSSSLPQNRALLAR